MLVGRIESEIFLAGIWISGLRGLRALAHALDLPELSARCARLLARAEAGFESFWSEEQQRYGFAHLVDGTLCADLTAYTAHPLSRGIGTPERARRTAAQLNRPELASGWGARMFSTRSSVYDPANYNTGSVFPYLANFNVLALFEHDQVLAGWQQLQELVALDGFSGLGLIPEHLVGDRREEPARGVPHQIFSSAALLQSAAHACVGLGAERFRPLVHPRMAHWSLGKARIEFDRANRRLRISGAPAHARIEPRAPHGSILRALRVEPGAADFEVVLGPWAEFRAPLRILASAEEPGLVRWRVAGPPGERAVLAFDCDRPVRIAGATVGERGLEMRLPDDPSACTVEHVIEFHLSDGDPS